MGVVARVGAAAVAVAVAGYLLDAPDLSPAAAGGGCVVRGVTAGPVAGFGTAQVETAAVIVAVGKRMGVPDRGRVVAVATAMQESRLRALDYGDRDSLGVFQQRPSQGWGTPAQVMDPAYAAERFYRALLATPGWPAMSVNDAAQAVQRSGFPHAYGQHEPAARAVVAAVDGARCT